jgi:hypothetical protein
MASRIRMRPDASHQAAVVVLGACTWGECSHESDLRRLRLGVRDDLVLHPAERRAARNACRLAKQLTEASLATVMVPSVGPLSNTGTMGEQERTRSWSRCDYAGSWAPLATNRARVRARKLPIWSSSTGPLGP